MAFTIYRHSTSDEAYKSPNLVKTNAGNCIGLLVASSCTNKGTICENDDWRIDNQNPSATHYNIQIQRNGVWNEKSSIGGVQIEKTLIARIGAEAANPAAKTARDAELTRALHAALTASVGSWRVAGPQNNRVYSFDFYALRGDFSS